jgi:hypothetical protein
MQQDAYIKDTPLPKLAVQHHNLIIHHHENFKSHIIWLVNELKFYSSLVRQ